MKNHKNFGNLWYLCTTHHYALEKMTEFIYDEYSRMAIETIRSGRSLFISGKAGTGKTMLLSQIVKEFKQKRKIAVCAPTGVAANHAGGVTLHSFFKLPIGIYLPGHKMDGLFNLKADQIQIVKMLQMLIIDEVSMVRCDTMDMIDCVLRYYREKDKPFGGLQVVLIGDLRQLMPVVKDEEWEKLKKHYSASYFFCSKVIEESSLPMLELINVHRQSDVDFVNLLNNVREGRLNYEDERILKARYNKDFSPADSAHYIRLTTHRYKTQTMNADRLATLGGKKQSYQAFIEGFVPKQDFPADWVLNLKVGARVMFIANDNREKQFFNGTLGTVVGLNAGIKVRTDAGRIISVGRHKWDFYSYKVNATTKEVERALLGTYHQYPLRLAWAITIHKSQGLTFDRVVIDAGRAFTYGQVYVALSRCRKLSGMTLVSPVTQDSIAIDPVITTYLQTVKQLWPGNVLNKEDGPEVVDGAKDPVVNFIQRTGYEPIGQLFTISKENRIYDCWEDASGRYYVDRLKETESGVTRISVGGYKENTVPFEILSAREYMKIGAINYYGGAVSTISVRDGNKEALYNYRGMPVKEVAASTENQEPLLNIAPNLRRYEYIPEGEKIAIRKISALSTSTPAVIEASSDLGKLILSCKKFKILRNSVAEFHIGVEDNGYRVVNYSLHGQGLSVEARALADYYYQSLAPNLKLKIDPPLASSPSTMRKAPIKKGNATPKTLSAKPVGKSSAQSTPRIYKSPPSPEDMIVRYMKDRGACLARTIAKDLSIDKSVVNSILYGSLTQYGRVVKTGNAWRLTC